MVGARFGFLAAALPPIALFIGFRTLRSKTKKDKKPAMFLVAAGLLGLVFRFAGIAVIKPFVGMALGVGAIAVIAIGLVKAIRVLWLLKTQG
jgi:hypothetical protein